MNLDLEPSTVKKLPVTVKSALSKMSTQDQLIFQEEFKKRARSRGVMLFFAIFFPIQHFLLGKPFIGLIFWFTGLGLFLWYITEWFLVPIRVRDYNADIATKIVTDMKIMAQ